MTDQPSGVSDQSRTGAMFDYDARPVTPELMLVGSRTSAGAYAIRDFLTRNGRPYEWVDAADFPETVQSSRLPLLSEYDLVIVGAGPAGLGAAVTPHP